MACNNLQPSSGPYYLAPGGTARITMWYGNPGDDHGAQWIMAHPLPGEYPCELVVSDFSKSLDYGLVGAGSGGSFDYSQASPYYRYAVTVTNWGPHGDRFNLQGGATTDLR